MTDPCIRCGADQGVKLLGVADTAPIGQCPACGVLRVHVKLEAVGIVRAGGIQPVLRVTGPAGSYRILGTVQPNRIVQEG